MLRRILSTVYWTLGTLWAAGIFPIAVLIWLIGLIVDPRQRFLHRFTCWWGASYTWFSPVWTVRLHGRDRIDPNARYLLVANHQSLLDILVMFRMRKPYKWVSKRENFRIPIVGQVMQMNGYINIARDDAKSIRHMIDRGVELIERGDSLLVFPEGTRSEDGRLLPFRTGAFKIAQKAGVQIIPVVIDGSAKGLRRGSLLVHRAQMSAHVLEPIAPETFVDCSAKELAARVQQVMTDKLAALHAPDR